MSKLSQMKNSMNDNNANSMAGIRGTSQNKNKNKKLATETYETDETNLYIKGLWKDCTQVELDDLFKPYGVIVQSRVYGDGIGFVRYETSQQALSALSSFNGTKPNPKCEHALIIKYAHKKPKLPKSSIKIGFQQIEMTVHANTKNVYIRGLPHYFNESDVYQLCRDYGTITCIRLCKNGFAFVRFLTGQDATTAIHNLHGKFLVNSREPLLVKLANSDPFEPRIEFYNLNIQNNDKSNLSVREVNSEDSEKAEKILTRSMEKLSVKHSSDNLNKIYIEKNVWEKSDIPQSSILYSKGQRGVDNCMVDGLPINENQNNLNVMEQPESQTQERMHKVLRSKFVNKKNLNNFEEEGTSNHKNDIVSHTTNTNSPECPQLNYSFSATSNESIFSSFSSNNYIVNNPTFGLLSPSLNNFPSLTSLTSVDGTPFSQQLNLSTVSSNGGVNSIGCDTNATSPNVFTCNANSMFWNPTPNFNLCNSNQLASPVVPLSPPNQMYNCSFSYNYNQPCINNMIPYQ